MWTKIRYWRSLLDILGSMAKTHSPLVFSLLALALIGTLPSSAAECEEKSKRILGELKLSEKDKKALLDVHNEFRQEIAAGNKILDYKKQPPAKNMLQLTWDTFAGLQASIWARTCQYGHNNPTDKRGKQLGQNLAVRRYSELSNVNETFNSWMKDMVQGWFEEVNNYTYGDPYTPENVHYTQMVWAKTSQLGCGYSYYKEIDIYNYIWHVGYLVCNYNPMGNWEGEVPYEIGNGDCETNEFIRSRKYNHLCFKKHGKH